MSDSTPTQAPHYTDSTVTLYHQPEDGFSVLASLPNASVDAIVTDPPYGLEFMGKEWDGADGFRRSLNPADVGRDNPFGRTSRTSPEYRAGALFQAWCEAWTAECLRVLKPGGHLLAFGGTRTWHRLACAVEDAGFEVRDSIAWLYGSGFPKSLNVSKAIDKAAGAEREVLGTIPDRWTGKSDVLNFATDRPQAEVAVSGGPVTPEAHQWEGWGTALKPAFEPIVVGRKPLVGTVAANVLAHGTGALNIDGCRTPTNGETLHTSTVPNDMRGGHYGSGHRPGEPSGQRRYTERGGTNFAATPGPRGGDPSGRWPANVVLDESQAVALDEQSGELTSGGGDRGTTSRDGFMGPDSARGRATRYERDSDSGGASRFFYVAKADASERVRVNGTAHPTVKPLALMRWLVRLVTPPGGTVLEPFAGSGTTVEACILEGFRCIAIEREADYLPLIVQRINRRRDPVEAVRTSGEDGGLFNLLDGGAA